MTKLQQTIALVKELSREDQLQLITQLLPTLYQESWEEGGITRSPDIAGGCARIANTRIPVWGIVEAKRLGYSDTEILDMHPTLSRSDIENALVYYAKHRDEIESELAEQEEVD